MNNYIVLKTVSIISFIISAIFTILLMTSGTVGIMGCILAIGMSIILELAKYGFFFEALSNDKLSTSVRVTLGTISIILISASIFASAAYIQNQSNKAKNIQTKDSISYSQLEQGRTIQQELYNMKKSEIADLKALQIKQQEEGEKIINNMPADYIDRKNQQRIITQNQIAETQKSIDKKMNELSQIADNLQKPLDVTKLKINEDNGYNAMFGVISNAINNLGNKESNISPELIEMWFFILLGIVFELVAVLTSYLAQLKEKSLEHLKTSNFLKNSNSFKAYDHLKSSSLFKPSSYFKDSKVRHSNPLKTSRLFNPSNILKTSKTEPSNPSNPSNHSKTSSPSNVEEKLETLNTTDFFKPSSVEEKKAEYLKRFNDFKPSSPSSPSSPSNLQTSSNHSKPSSPSRSSNTSKPSSLDEDSMKKYTEYMYSTLKNGNECKGYTPIAKNIGIGIETARKIKAYLETSGIIKTVGTKTFVLLDLQACKEKLQVSAWASEN